VIPRGGANHPPSEYKISRMGNAVDEWQDLRLVDFQVGFRLTVSVEVLLRFPTLNQHEEGRFVFRMIDLESCTARFQLRKRPLLNEQLFDLVNVRFIFDRQKYVAVNHVVVSVTKFDVESGTSGRRWRSTRWGLSFSLFDVVSASFGVVVGGQSFDFLAVLRFVKQLFDKGDAPSAAGTGAVAFADLAGTPRFVDADEVADFPLGYMKAVADFIVGLHESLFTGRSPNCHSFFRRDQSNGIFVNDSKKPALSPCFGEDCYRSCFRERKGDRRFELLIRCCRNIDTNSAHLFDGTNQLAKRDRFRLAKSAD
jgi:hypothetical protein